MAIVLASRLESVYLWVSGPDLARRMQAARENDVYLPGLLVPPSVEITTDLAAALADADIVLCVVPSHFARGLWQRALPHLDPKASIFVSATKGLEAGTHMRMSEVLAEVLRSATSARPEPHVEPRIAVLSGPTFAREIAHGEPAAVVVASSEAETATR